MTKADKYSSNIFLYDVITHIFGKGVLKKSVNPGMQLLWKTYPTILQSIAQIWSKGHEYFVGTQVQKLQGNSIKGIPYDCALTYEEAEILVGLTGGKKYKVL